MRKQDFFFFIIILVIIAIFYVEVQSMKRQKLGLSKVNETAVALAQSLATENRFSSGDLSGLIIQDVRENQTPLSKIISPGVNILIVTSLHDCDECRDLELQRWGLFAKSGNGLPTHLVLLDEPSRSNERMAKSLSGLDCHFEVDNFFANNFNLAHVETPIILFVDNALQVVACYKGHYSTQERSANIHSLVEALSKTR